MKWIVKQRPWALLLLVLAGVGICILTAGRGFPLDDSWIHQAYGRNLGLRGEWALIPGQPSAASTAPFYTVLLSVGYFLRIPYLLWTHLLGILALWGIAIFGARLADRLAPENPYAGLITGGLLAITWQLVWAAASGMETALFAMWTVWLWYLVWRESEDEQVRTSPALIGRGVLFGASGALAILTRPEGAVMVGVCGLALLIVMPRGFWWWVLGAVLGFAVLITPYFVLNLQLTGGLLPNTSAAKQAQHAPLMAFSYPRRLWMMLYPVFIGGQVLLLPGVLASLRNAFLRGSAKRMWGLWLVPLAWLFGLTGLYAARLPAAYQHGRYVMSAIPVVVVIGVAGTLHLLKISKRRMLARVIVRSFAGSAVAVFIVMWLGIGPGVLADDVAIINQEMVAAAMWIDENIPVTDFMAIHDIGAVAYFTPRPMLDIAGLVSPEVIPIVNDGDALWALMEEKGAKYLMAFDDQVPGDDVADPRLCLVFETGGERSPQKGGTNMTVYALAWDGNCDHAG